MKKEANVESVRNAGRLLQDSQLLDKNYRQISSNVWNCSLCLNIGIY
jgi:hypothetical protein